jgi:phosphopantetheine adenylyltransferase
MTDRKQQMVTREEIKKAPIHLDKNWQMQNNHLDSSTKFIYTNQTIAEVKANCTKNNIDFNYALHRWYNFNCAKLHEDIFIKSGAKKNQDPYHKTIDFYLFDIPFDLKTTYFPKAINDRTNYDLTNRKGKNNLIIWLYNNQSKQGRFHLENRLFIVCEDLESKSNFEMIEEKVKCFIDFSKQNGFNKVQLVAKSVYSDIIWITR